MKNRLPSLLLTSFLLIASSVCWAASCSNAQQSAPPKNSKKILLLHSYHKEYPWVAAITAGVHKALAGQDIILNTFYMGTKRNPSYAWKVRSGEAARKMVDDWKPDAVIAADDDAQIFVTQYYANRKPWFVFCGVNGDPADYNLPARNVTGIIERPFFSESLAYLKQILRNSSRIIKILAVISDTGLTSIGALTFMRSEAKHAGVTVLGYHLIDSYTLWQKRIEEYNKIEALAVCIYTYHTIKRTGDQTSMEPQEVLQWTVANSIMPTVGFLDFAIEDGLLCGVVESGEEHGYEAALMALELLRGKDIKSLPVKRAGKGLKMINLKTAERLGISVPEDVIKTADRVIR